MNSEQPPTPTDPRISVSRSGGATAQDGGVAISGVRDSAVTGEVHVTESGAATAIGPGAVAVSGVLSVTVQQPLPPTPYAVQTTLPGDLAAFTGRVDHVEAITVMVRPEANGRGRPTNRGVVVAIDGMPGVGKTALALHAAHQLKDQFPGRQLFLDLRGHTPGSTPVAPFEALGWLLADLGMDTRYLPATLDQRVAHWRDRMAGQEALLVLDNAFDSKQVSPLLPGGTKTLVLITSRRYLGDLDGIARSITLNPLPEDEAQELFRRLAPRAVSDSDTAVAEVVIDLAGCLPLAIALLGRVYSNHPTWTLQVLIDKTRDRLLTVKAENNSIGAAFDLSYATLTESQQRVFALLGLHPGTEIDDFAAAALAGVARHDAAEVLEDLYNARLLTESSAEHPGRYRMHDLVRSFIHRRSTVLPADVRERALDRLLDYYQNASTKASALLSRYCRPVTGDPVAELASDCQDLSDQTAALRWARTERGNLLACIDLVTSSHKHSRVVALTATIEGLLRRDGPMDEALRRHGAAINAAIHTGDRDGQAGALVDLAVVQALTDDYSAASSSLMKALALYRECRNGLGEANALTELGVVRWMTGTYRESIQYLRLALAFYEESDDSRGRALTLNNLGIALQLTGDYGRAREVLEEALALYVRDSDQLGAANTLSNLGAVFRVTAEYARALEHQQHALALYEEVGNILGQGNALKEIGILNRLSGHYPVAIDRFTRALKMQKEVGNRLGQANILKNLGATLGLAGDPQNAARLLEEALVLYSEIGDRLGQADATKFLGSARMDAGDYEGAEQLLSDALSLCRELEDQIGVVEVLNLRGKVRRRLGDIDRAMEDHVQARDVSRLIGSRRDEAIAIAGISNCYVPHGRISEARSGLREALAVLRQLGAAESTEVAHDLASLEGHPASEELQIGPGTPGLAL